MTKHDSQPTVYIVDDECLIRDMIEMMLSGAGFQCESFESATDFLQQYNRELFGCLVLDIRMPDMSGMTLQKKLSELNANLPIVFITGHGGVELAVEAIKLGAYDFLEKPFREDVLLEKVSGALALSRQQQQQESARDAILQKVASLTPREKEIMELVAQGNANKVIAANLGIAQGTVEIHRSRIMSKMSVKNLAELNQTLVKGMVI